MKEYFDKLYIKGQAEFEKMLYTALDKGEKKFVITANPETLMIGQSNKEFDQILKSDEIIIVPDGIGVVKAARLLGTNVSGRVTGVELSKGLLEYANRTKKKICLFGAKEDVLQTLLNKIKKEYPEIVIGGYANGYVQDKVLEMKRLVECEPDIMLVALGIPQQELLINKYFSEVKKGVYMGVGGSFDVLSGTKRRAPKIFIKLNLEWLYRIVKEPKRIKRFLKSNIVFIVKVLKLKGGR